MSSSIMASTTAAQNDAAISQQSSTSLQAAKRNMHYLISPSSQAAGNNSIRLRTRLLLRSAHHIGSFILWRLVRYAKYIAVGSLVAAVGASALGTALTPVAWLVAPPTLMASLLAAMVWGVGGFVARRVMARWRSQRGIDADGKGREVQGSRVSGRGRTAGLVSADATPW